MSKKTELLKKIYGYTGTPTEIRKDIEALLPEITSTPKVVYKVGDWIIGNDSKNKTTDPAHLQIGKIVKVLKEGFSVIGYGNLTFDIGEVEWGDNVRHASATEVAYALDMEKHKVMLQFKKNDK